VTRNTHEKQLERARARRAAERDEARRATAIVVTLVSVLVVGALALGAVLLVRGGDDVADDVLSTPVEEESAVATTPTSDSSAVAEATSSPVACPGADGEVPEPTTEPYGERPAADVDGLDTLTATLRTTCGEIIVALHADEAPTTVETFVALAEDGYYDGTPFHRVIEDFMIQGGDPTGTGTGCLDAQCDRRLPGYTFGDELGLAEEVVAEHGGYPRGTLAMANAGPDTNGSQFFIVQAEPAYPLPPSYAVFGEVVEGMDVVDRIVSGPVEGDLAVDPTVVVDVEVERCAPTAC
jgi:cyclophilin family peptidyl-prolyl cis-trans isomerase